LTGKHPRQMEVFAWRMAQVVHLDNHTLHHAHAAARISSHQAI
jgi:hypothetical protein